VMSMVLLRLEEGIFYGTWEVYSKF
jgi:hypothetical protein